MKGNKHIHYLPLASLLLVIFLPAMAAAPGDLVFKREDQSTAVAFPPSIFPHWKHRINYRCDACHDSLFKMERDTTPINMDLIREGKVCGTCHNGEIAFDDSFTNCSRCHRVLPD